ncbi:mitogen-activated protein kinase kinase kinase npk1, partial [Fagus crenata]
MPLYEEFYNSLAACSPSFVESTHDETTLKYLKLRPKSRSPSQGPTGAPSPAVDSLNTGSLGNSRCALNIGYASDQSSQDNPSHSLL